MLGKRVKRGVSPLLATIILIAITVAAGLVIYNLFFGTAGTASSQLNIQVQSVDIVQTSSVTLISATIKNSGNKPITYCHVFVYVEGTTTPVDLNLLPSGTMDPGQTKSASTTTLPSGASVTVGKSYPVTISVMASDGSRLDKSLTVTCMG